MKILTALVLTLAGLAIGSLGCTKSDDSKLNVLRIPLTDEVGTLDPAVAYDLVSSQVLYSVFDTLYQYDYLASGYKLVPLLAADLPKYSADGLTVTIPLRQDVHFQDDPAFKDSHGKGRRLKAGDFIYAWKRLALPSLRSPGWWLWDGRIVGMNEFHDKLLVTPAAKIQETFAEKVEGLRAPDDHTIQITLKKPYPQLLSVLSLVFTAPVAEEAVRAYGTSTGELPQNPVGTGPFQLTKWKRGKLIELERNPTYHSDFFPKDGAGAWKKNMLLGDVGKTLPLVDKLLFSVQRDPAELWSEFMEGTIDLAPIPRTELKNVVQGQGGLSPTLAKKGYRLHSETGTSFYFLTFNMADKLIGTNKLLRQAISASIDRDRWIEHFAQGRGRKQVNSLPPGVADRPATGRIKYDFNRKKAKNLLDAAGFPTGRGLPSLTIDMRGSDQAHQELGEFFKDQLLATGIQARVIYNTTQEFNEKARRNAFQISYGGWSLDYPDAENVFQLLYGGNKTPGPNVSNYDSPRMNALYERMAVMEPGPERAKLIAEMDELLQEDVPWALGYYATQFVVSQPLVQNFRPSDIILNKYKYVRVKR